MLPTGVIADWLSLSGIRERKDNDVPCRHSGFSGHNSAKGETAEDEEIKRINEHPCRKSPGSTLSERDSRVPDSGIPRESDHLSCLSGETNIAATTQSVESIPAVQCKGGEACDAAYPSNEVLSQPLKKTEIRRTY